MHELADVLSDLAKIDFATNNLRKLLEDGTFAQRNAAASPAAGHDRALCEQPHHRRPSSSRSATPLAPGTPTTSATTPPLPTGRILVVDDEPLNREMLLRRLARMGFTTSGAPNGREALEIMTREPFDLVLLDIMMPIMDGYETLDRLKADRKLRHIPVVMLTALDEVASTVRCIEAGAEDYVPKPFNPVILRARIGASLEKSACATRERAHLCRNPGRARQIRAPVAQRAAQGHR